MKSNKPTIKSTNDKDNVVSSERTWEEIKGLLKEERYRKQIQKLSSETLQSLIEKKNDAKIHEYASNAIETMEPDKLTDEYIIEVANGMKRLAEIVLEERNKR